MIQIIILMLHFLFTNLVECQTCLWPDGSIAASYQPCNTTTAQCCYNSDPRHRDFCFDNGLCMSMLHGGVYRGACSDPLWSPGSGCARYCIDVNLNAASPVTACGTKMCCGSVLDPSVMACYASTDTKPDSDIDGFSWGNSTVSNLGNCPREDEGLSKSDIIAIIAGSAAVSVALIAWIWPRHRKTWKARFGKHLENLAFWRRR